MNKSACGKLSSGGIDNATDELIKIIVLVDRKFYAKKNRTKTAQLLKPGSRLCLILAAAKSTGISEKQNPEKICMKR